MYGLILVKTSQKNKTLKYLPFPNYYMTIKKGNKVKLEYTGTLEDGTVFDSSEKHGTLLEFEVGSGKVIPGLDKALIGMKKGEEKEIKIEPSNAYGSPNPQLVQKIPKEKLPKEPEPKPGMVLGIQLPNGAQAPVRITEVEENTVTLDLNHPLAGKTLIFKIKVVDFS